MQRLEETLDRLDAALTAPAGLPQSWRQLARARLADVSEALTDEQAVAADTWLDARAGQLHRERNRLLARVSVLGPLVDNGDLDAVRVAAARLLTDVQHHHQRVSDLEYDAVGMD